MDFVEEYSFSDLLSRFGNPLRFDFAIFHLKERYCLVEYQGSQHFDYSNDFGYEQREFSDPAKRAYCKRKNERLLEIPYYLDNIFDELMDVIIDMYDVDVFDAE